MPSSNSEDRFPTFARGANWLISWGTIRKVVIVILILTTAAGLFYTEEKQRGRRVWQKYKRELEARGERLDPAAFIPPAVLPDQNFATTPLLAPLFNYSRDSFGANTWKDSNGVARAMSFGAWLDDVSFAHGWSEGHRLDLGKIQTSLLALTNKIVSERLVSRIELSPPHHLSAAARPEEEILFVLAQLKPDLDELRAALRRPQSRFPLHYQDNFSMLIPHLKVLMRAVDILTLQALAELQSGKTDDAFADTITALKLAETIKSEPILVSALARAAMIHDSIQAIWEGLLDHRWNENQIRALQEQLAPVDFLNDYQQCIRSELAFIVVLVEPITWKEMAAFAGDNNDPMFRLMPRGWLYQNLLSIARAHEEISLPSVDVKNQRAYVSRVTSGAQEFLKPGPFNILNRLALPNLESCLRRFSAEQTAANEAVVACALERFRQGKGNYPGKLEEISPGFLEKIPHDVTNGQPLKYRREANGFILYSVGWNERDDDGTPSTERRGSGNGDWVWTSAATPK